MKDVQNARFGSRRIKNLYGKPLSEMSVCLVSTAVE